MQRSGIVQKKNASSCRRGKKANTYEKNETGKIRNKFNSEEDSRLIELVKEYTKGIEYDFSSITDSIWGKIAQNMPNRNVRQCHDRWVYYLSPSVNRNPWTQEEDSLLMSLISSIGLRWVQISKLIKGRTDTQIKNRYNAIKKIFVPFNPIPMVQQPIPVVEPVENMIDFSETIENIFDDDDFSYYDDLYEI